MIKSPTQHGASVPGLLIRYRYATGENSHISQYASEAKQLEAARHLATLSHCMAVDLCMLKQARGLTTGCKLFDKQHQALITGNIVSNTCLGQYIRPRQELKCNGHTWEPGALQHADLKAFNQLDRCGSLRRHIEKSPHFVHDGGICYVLMHWLRECGRHRAVVHGALITDRHFKRIATLSARDLGVNGSPKSMQIMQAATPFLTDEITSHVTPFYRAATLA